MTTGDEAQQDALNLLEDIRSWEASATAWPRIDALVAAIQDAASRNAVDALDSATAKLELYSPDRANDARKGEKGLRPGPSEVLDRISDTIHTLRLVEDTTGEGVSRDWADLGTGSSAGTRVTDDEKQAQDSPGRELRTPGERERQPDDGSFVFISYSGSDLAWAMWVGGVLEAAGLPVRLQEWDSPPGRNFAVWINEQLGGARWTMALYSKQYFASPWCTSEWAAALDGETLLPVRLEPVLPPPVLATRTYVDVFDVAEGVARDRVLAAVGRYHPPRTGPFPGGAITADLPAFPGTGRYAGEDEPRPSTGATRAAPRRILPPSQQTFGNR